MGGATYLCLAAAVLLAALTSSNAVKQLKVCDPGDPPQLLLMIGDSLQQLVLQNWHLTWHPVTSNLRSTCASVAGGRAVRGD
jgi:hypothetical protein